MGLSLARLCVRAALLLPQPALLSVPGWPWEGPSLWGEGFGRDGMLWEEAQGTGRGGGVHQGGITSIVPCPRVPLPSSLPPESKAGGPCSLGCGGKAWERGVGTRLGNAQPALHKAALSPRAVEAPGTAPAAAPVASAGAWGAPRGGQRAGQTGPRGWGCPVGRGCPACGVGGRPLLVGGSHKAGCAPSML